MPKLAAQLLHDTDGQDLIEYALLAATIALAVVTAMGAVRNALNSRFTAISAAVAS